MPPLCRVPCPSTQPSCSSWLCLAPLPTNLSTSWGERRQARGHGGGRGVGQNSGGAVAWRGVAWRGVVWRGVVWRGVAWRGVAWCGMAWCGFACKHLHLPDTQLLIIAFSKPCSAHAHPVTAPLCRLPACSKYWAGTVEPMTTPLVALQAALPGTRVSYSDSTALKYTGAGAADDVAACEVRSGGGARRQAGSWRLPRCRAAARGAVSKRTVC